MSEKDRTEGFADEIFRSIQGEGKYLGVAQAFLRMSGCALRCSYCDTGRAKEAGAECLYHISGRADRVKNPLSPKMALSLIRRLIDEEGPVHSLSITGGEPLEQPGFVTEVSRIAKSSGITVYLETNGLHPEAFRAAARYADIISMDIKLPSLCGGGDLFSVYEEAIPSAGEKDMFCKIVIAEGFDFEEFEKGVSLIASAPKPLTLVIQPATIAGSDERRVPSLSVDAGTMLRCYNAAARVLDDVRVIPQCHGILGVI